MTKGKSLIEELNSKERELLDVTDRWMREWRDEGLSFADVLSRLMTVVSTFTGTLAAVTTATLMPEQEKREELAKKMVGKMAEIATNWSALRTKDCNEHDNEESSHTEH